ncbi:hypothetical protein HHK36_028901 [Tetracentron sinense]|uniref:Cation/H+ exchanger transmembrane domain-containing protein n=1 Tax=Tetracentron sinense TaxID=13715 RepID=A0A835D111_TETSI|nr:hypothetical protein HHK36_028901 [Tetracentron sinense]
MDLACCFRHPNVFHGGEGSSSRSSSDYFNSYSRFGFRGFSCNFIGNPRLVSKACVSKKVMAFSGYVDSSMPRGGEFDKFLLGSHSRKYLNCNFDNYLKVLSAVVRLQCQNNDSLAYIDGNGRNVEFIDSSNETMKDSLPVGSRGESIPDAESNSSGEEEEVGAPSLDDLKDLLQKALKELEVALLNSTMFEEKAQKISETAIALKDEGANAWNAVNLTLNTIQEVISEEAVAKIAVQKATMALSMAEARLQLASESLDTAKGRNVSLEDSRESDLENERRMETSSLLRVEEDAFLVAQDDIKSCKATLENCEAELRRLQNRKEKLQKEVDRLSEVAERAQMDALKAEEDVTNIMLLAEQAVAFELEAKQHVNDAEIALQRAEKFLSKFNVDLPDTSWSDASLVEEEKVSRVVAGDFSVEGVREGSLKDAMLGDELDHQSDITGHSLEELNLSDELLYDQENGKLSVDSHKEAEAEKSKTVVQAKKQEMKKDLTKDNSPLSAPKAWLKKSSRFFSASFFSFTVDGAQFTPASVFHSFIVSSRQQVPKLVFGVLLLGVGVTFLINRAERSTLLLQQPDVITTGIEEVSSNAKPLVREIRRFPKRVKKLIEMLPHQEINEEEASLFDMLWLLLASVIFVPTFQKIPGGSPVLGYLAAGILIGPYGLSIIRHVHGTKAIAEFGVVFLLFNIGLELSVERLSSMKKYVFGLGSAQVLVTAVVIGLVAHFVSGQAGPAAIVIGNGLALSSTAVVLQVLQERGESTSRHGRATFSVLLFQYVNTAIHYYSLEEDSRRLFPATGQAIFLQRQTLMEEYHARYARPAYNETYFQLRRRYYAKLTALRESNHVYLHILDRARTVRRDRQEQADQEEHDPLLDVDSVLDRFSDTDESFDD